METHPSTPDLSSLEVARLVEYGEAAAYADMMAAAPASLGMRAERFGQAIAIKAASAPIMLFNRVIGLGLEEAVSDDVLERIHSLYAGSPVYGVQLAPMASLEPARLERHGLARTDRWAKVYREASSDADVPTDLEMVRVGPEQVTAFARVACEVFGMPPSFVPWLEAIAVRSNWRAYAALEHDRVVAVGTMFTHGDVAWLGIGGTLASHRRRGAQGAIMARRITEAASLGCRFVITETGEDLPEQPNPSYHNMVRTGFRLAYQRPNFVARAG